MKTRKNAVIIQKIIDYCEQIRRTKSYFGETEEKFTENRIFQDSANMCVLQIGELAGKLDLGFRNKYPGVPWRQINGLRNVYAHAYGEVDLKRAWEVLDKDVPYLEHYCRKIKKELEKEPDKSKKKKPLLP